jgi:hypothetical protein
MLIEGVVGPQVKADGSLIQPRLGNAAEVVVQQDHGKYLEAVYRGQVFSLSSVTAGVVPAAANVSPLAATTGAPLVGIVNPVTSGKIAVIMRVVFGIQSSGALAVNPGIPVYNVLSSVLTTQVGTVPFNNRLLAVGGSAMIGLVNQALTGQSPAVVWTVYRAMSTGSLSGNVAASTVPWAVAQEDLDGEIIVLPGAAFGIAVAAAATAVNVTSALIWEEIAF